MFLHHIQQQKEDSLLFRFFIAQMKNQTKGDWVSSVLEDIEELELGIELEEIKYMSKDLFKKTIKSQVELKAFESLINKKESRHSEHAKGKLLKYSKLEMQGYLSASGVNISIEEKKWLFSCRIEDIDLSTNHRWKNEETLCRFCKTIEMSQKHLINCKYLSEKNQVLINSTQYEDIFEDDIEKQVNTNQQNNEDTFIQIKTPRGPSERGRFLCSAKTCIMF